ncbi:MAG: VanZ family protein [Burkholderiaceae bacterium]|nr:VanZ family protein [Burkholderiaceae bacterium]
MRRDAVIRAAFWLALAAVLVLSLWPSPEPPPVSTGWDKSDHAVAWFVVGLLGVGAYGNRPRLWGALWAYGGAIELLQGLTGYRTGDWGDWFADAVGIGLALVLGAIARRCLRARLPFSFPSAAGPEL